MAARLAAFEEAGLQGALLDQLAQTVGAQSGDPAQARILAQILDAGVGEHAPVADQDQPPQAEAAAQGLDLVGHGGGIGGVAGIGAHRDRASVAVRQQAVDHGRTAALAVATVAEAHQRAGAAFVVAAGDIVEHLGIVAEVAFGQAALNGGLAFMEPVHSGMEVVFARPARAGVPPRGWWSATGGWWRVWRRAAEDAGRAWPGHSCGGGRVCGRAGEGMWSLRQALRTSSTWPWKRERTMEKASSRLTRGSLRSSLRRVSTLAGGQEERLARVRLRTRLPSRQPSRRRTAGGELRFGTMSTYMGTLYTTEDSDIN